MNHAVHCAAFDARYFFEMQRVVKIGVKPSSACQQGVHRDARQRAWRGCTRPSGWTPDKSSLKEEGTCPHGPLSHAGPLAASARIFTVATGPRCLPRRVPCRINGLRRHDERHRRGAHPLRYPLGSARFTTTSGVEGWPQVDCSGIIVSENTLFSLKIRHSRQRFGCREPACHRRAPRRSGPCRKFPHGCCQWVKLTPLMIQGLPPSARPRHRTQRPAAGPAATSSSPSNSSPGVIPFAMTASTAAALSGVIKLA